MRQGRRRRFSLNAPRSVVVGLVWRTNNNGEGAKEESGNQRKWNDLAPLAQNKLKRWKFVFPILKSARITFYANWVNIASLSTSDWKPSQSSSAQVIIIILQTSEQQPNNFTHQPRQPTVIKNYFCCCYICTDADVDADVAWCPLCMRIVPKSRIHVEFEVLGMSDN